MLLSVGYNLHIKFVQLSNELINEETKSLLCSSIKGFDKIINNNPITLL